MMENIPKPLSENEVLKLFEKMMVRIVVFHKMVDVKTLASNHVNGTITLKTPVP